MHKAFLISGGRTMSTSINRTILMVSQHGTERGLDPIAPIKMQTRVV